MFSKHGALTTIKAQPGLCYYYAHHICNLINRDTTSIILIGIPHRRVVSKKLESKEEKGSKRMNVFLSTKLKFYSQRYQWFRV